MFKVYDKWSKLEEVVLGRSYSAEFYENIKNPRIKSCLKRIADETEEDYEYFHQQLKSNDVLVHRPILDPSDRIENYVDNAGRIMTNLTWQNNNWVNECNNQQNVYVSNYLIPKPPMHPRDCWIVIDGNILETSTDHPAVEKIIKNIAGSNQRLIIDTFQEFNSEGDLCGGNMYQIGKDLFFGTNGIDQQVVDQVTARFPNFNWHFVKLEGHNDGVYHPIKPGAIISTENGGDYDILFPGWDVLFLPYESWHKMHKFAQLKNKNQGKWWLPGEEDNDEFTFFVETWLNSWVGYAEESVFDANCLVLDEHHVFINNHNKLVEEFLQKHNMEPIVVPFRHRYFWDGGIHCNTLEIRRSGDIKSYL